MRLLVLAALVAALVVVAPAHPYSAGGTPWPTTRIAVWNETPYRLPLAQAMASWNAVGARVTLVPAARRSGARVVVRTLEAGVARPGRAGLGTVGWTPALVGEVAVRRGLDQRAAATVIAHELGHVLGLGHEERRCSLMSGSLIPGGTRACPVAGCADVARCLVQADDAAGLRELYERRLPALRPLRVRSVSAHVSGGRDGAVRLAWTSPRGGPGTAVLVRVERARCPDSPYARPLARTSSVVLRRGTSQAIHLAAPGAGTWCAGVWVQEGASFLIGAPVYVQLTIP